MSGSLVCEILAVCLVPFPEHSSLESCLSRADVYLLERRTSVNQVNNVR